MSERTLVTGTSSGFGKLIVRGLLDAGHQVAASMRDVGGRNAKPATELRDAGAHIVELDVTDDESVERGVSAAAEGLGGLTALVNNAGIGVTGLQESFTSADFQRLFDINVFGVQRMNRAVMPRFREQRQGLLVYISSLLGRITIPFYGPYNASKWAVEALAENYRAEVSGFGVESCIVEPGGYPTTFMDNLMRPSDRSREPGYGEMATAPEATLKGFHDMLLASPEQDPSNVARTVVDLFGTRRGARPFRSVVDNIGMGAGVEPYNQAAQELTERIYSNMQISHMLELDG